MPRTDDTRTATRESFAAILVAALVGMGLIAYSLLTPLISRPGPDADSFWTALRIDADEVEGYASLAEMHAQADAVVVGRLTSFEPGRVFQGDAAEDKVGYAVAKVEVVELIRGGDLADGLPLEFLLSSGKTDFEAQVTALAADLPEERVVLFLRAKRGSGEEGLWRVVNSKGLWAATSRAFVDAPLSVEPPTTTDLYATELKTVGSIDDLIELLRSYGG